jgi:hypothetical protein
MCPLFGLLAESAISKVKAATLNICNQSMLMDGSGLVQQTNESHQLMNLMTKHTGARGESKCIKFYQIDVLIK